MPIEQDILSISFDYKKTQEDAAKVVASMQSVYDAADKLTNVKVSLNTAAGFTDSKKGADAVTEALKQASKATQDYSNAALNNSKVLTENAKQQTENAKQSTEASKQLTESAKQQTEAAKRLSESNKRDTEQTKAAADAKLKGAKAATEAAKQDDIRTKTTIALTKEQDRQAKAAEAKAKTIAAAEAKEGKEAELLANDYKQLSMAYNEAALKAKNLALQQGSNTPAAKAALAEANVLRDKLYEVDSLTGSYTRNVGNYFGAIGQAFSKTYGFLRVAANIIPGLGISGILLLAYEGITKLVEAAFTGEKALNKLAIAHKMYTETILEASKSSADEVVGLRVLEKVATDVTKPMSVRLQAVKDLKDEYPKYLSNISDEAILHGQAAKQINLVAEALYKKAFAEAASSKAASVAGTQLELELRKNFLIQEQAKAQAKLNKALADNVTDADGVNVQAQIQVDRLEKLNSLLKKNTEQYDFNSEQIKFFTDKAAENFETVKKLEIDPKGKKEKDVRTIADALADLENKLKSIQSEQDLGVLSFKEADVERAKAYIQTITELTDKFKLNAKSGVVVDLTARLNPVYIRIFERQIKDFADKNSTKIDLLPPPEAAKKRLDNIKSYVDDEAKLYEEVLQRELTIQETASLKEQQDLQDRFNHGKISREQYEKDLIEIHTRYALKAAQTSIDYLQQEVNMYEAGTKAREDAEKRLAAAKLALSKATLDQQKKNNQELVNDLQKIQGALNQVGGIIGGAISASVTAQKNALQDLEDQQQKNYQNEIDRINSSSLTDAEKVDKIKVLEAQRQAQKETFDRKNREADRKKAEFDKATAIMNIILNTAAAVVKALPNFLLAALVGGLGAAQLAVAIATPIPKYAKGLKNASKDHIGIAGEAGAERVDMPGRNPFIVDEETKMFIPKGTSITPISGDQINSIMYRGMIKQTAATVQNKSDRSEALLAELVKETRKNNGKKINVNARLLNDNKWEQYKRNYYS